MSIHNLATGVTSLTSNAFLVDGESPALVDTGAGFDIIEEISSSDLSPPSAVVLTHTHPDHVGNVEAVVEEYDVPVFGYDPDSPYVTESLDDDDHIVLGDDEYTVWYTPGHAPDHLCLYSEDALRLFSGDLIFPNGGVGRTDLPGCDHEALIESIRHVYTSTSSSLTELLAGHGPIVDTDAYRHVAAAARFVGIE